MKRKKIKWIIKGNISGDNPTHLKVKFQIDYELINGDVDGNIWGCDIMAYSKKQALFLFARRHKNKEYKILQVTDWGVQFEKGKGK